MMDTKELLDKLKPLQMDVLTSDYSKEEECFFIYGQKGNVKFFFNLFSEKNNCEALVNISTSNGKYTIEDNVENALQQLFDKIL